MILVFFSDIVFEMFVDGFYDEANGVQRKSSHSDKDMASHGKEAYKTRKTH